MVDLAAAPRQALWREGPVRALLAGEGGNMTLTPVPDPAPAGQVFVIESIGWWSEDVQGPGDRCRKCGWPREDHAATSITKEWVDDATRACGWCIEIGRAHV